MASSNIPEDFISEALETEQPRIFAKPFNPYSYLLSKFIFLEISKNSSTVSFQITSTSGDANWESASSLTFVAEQLAITEEQITDRLTVRKLKTSSVGARIEAEGTMLKVFGTNNISNIVFGVNSDGQSVLTYYNNQGEKLYDLGPSGIAFVQARF